MHGQGDLQGAQKKVTKVSPCKNREERQAPLLAAPRRPLRLLRDFTTGNLFGELRASGANIMLEDRLEGAPAQPGRGPATWNWALFDAVYAQALAIGVRPVWTFWDAPCWAAPSL